MVIIEKNSDNEDFIDFNNNPIVLQFDKYLRMNFSNETTRHQYYCRCVRFVKELTKKLGEPPETLTQEMLDDYVIFLNSKKTQNPNYIGFIKALRRAFDPKERIFFLNTKMDRSRRRQELTDTETLTKEQVEEIVKRASPLISVSIDLFFDTSSRKSELLKLDLEDEEWNLDLNKRTMITQGKGNKVHERHFSSRVAKRLYEFMSNPKLCPNPSKPFLLYKKNGEPYKNQSFAYWDRLRKECNFLNIRLPSGRSIYVHNIRHAVGKYLTQIKGWKIEQTAVKLGHTNVRDTMRYAKPSREEIKEKEDKEVFGE